MGVERQVVLLVVIGFLMVGLLSFTIYRELRWANEIEKRTITKVREKKEVSEKEKRGEEGETGEEEVGEVEKEEFVETTKISRSVQIHYDVLAAFIGAGLASISLLIYWISGFLGLIKTLGEGKSVDYENIALSSVLLLTALFVIFGGFVSSVIAVLTL